MKRKALLAILSLVMILLLVACPDKKIIDDEEPCTEYTVEVLKPEGEGTVTPGPDTYTHQEGEILELEAEPEEGWEFVKWIVTVDGEKQEYKDPVLELTVVGDMTIKAVFEEEEPGVHTLTINIEGQGDVEKDPDKALYSDGEIVELTAIPESGWDFIEWSGDLTAWDTTVDITMDGDKEVTAVFAAETYAISVVIYGEGRVEKDPEPPYTYGDIVELTAIPEPGWEFTEWGAHLSGSDNPQFFTVYHSSEVFAYFDEIEPDE